MTEREVINIISQNRPHRFIAMRNYVNNEIYFGNHIDNLFVKIHVTIYKSLDLVTLRFYIKQNNDYIHRDTILAQVKFNTSLRFLKHLEP